MDDHDIKLFMENEGYSESLLAEKLNISEKNLRYKLKNINKFTSEEINLLIKLLNIKRAIKFFYT